MADGAPQPGPPGGEGGGGGGEGVGGGGTCFNVGFSEDENLKWRKSMEDAHVILAPFMSDASAGFFAVYDGHGGKEAADMAAAELHTLLAALLGATAVTCLIRTEAGTRRLYAANAGDARAVLCRNSTALRLTKDHKASDAGEQERVQQAGGWVSMSRVHGVLAVSRALGDHAMKQSVICDPFVWSGELSSEDTFVIIACDGLWDVCSDQAAVDLVKDIPDAQEMASVLTSTALEKGAKDNISVIVVRWAPLP